MQLADIRTSLSIFESLQHSYSCQQTILFSGLFYPFKEQLCLPPSFVDIGNRVGGQFEIVR